MDAQKGLMTNPHGGEGGRESLSQTVAYLGVGRKARAQQRVLNHRRSACEERVEVLAERVLILGRAEDRGQLLPSDRCGHVRILHGIPLVNRKLDIAIVAAGPEKRDDDVLVV